MEEIISWGEREGKVKKNYKFVLRIKKEKYLQALESKVSVHFWLKKLFNLAPASPISDSSSLKVLQLSNIKIISERNSSLVLYLERGREKKTRD